MIAAVTRNLFTRSAIPYCLCAIIALGIGLRLALALTVGYLYDEIVFVDWVGSWFADHLTGYAFQLWHSSYPPQSPSFSNPPFAMYLYGIAIAVGRALGSTFSLFSARLVNVTFFVPLALLVYGLARQWLPAAYALVAPAFVAVAPPLVVAGGTTYVEQIAVTFALAALLALVRFVRLGKQTLFWVAAFFSALALLSKLSILPYEIAFLGLLGWAAWQKRISWVYCAAFPIVSLAVIYVLWSGARDIHQLQAAYGYVTQRRDNPGLRSLYPTWYKIVYYPVMLFGTQAALTSFAFIAVALDVVQRSMRRALSRGEAMIWGCILLALVPLALLVGFSTRHQITVVLPLLGVALAFWAARVAARIPRTPRLGRAVACVASAALVLSPFAVSPRYWPSFTNVLVGRLDSEKVFASGDGELIRDVDAWLANHASKRGKIGILYGVFLAQKYANPELRTRLDAVYESDTERTLMLRGIRYVVLPRDAMSFQSFSLRDVISNLVPIGIVYALHQPFYYIYDLQSVRTRQDAALHFSYVQGGISRLDFVRRGQVSAYKNEVIQFKADIHSPFNALRLSYRVTEPCQVYVDLVGASDSHYLRLTLNDVTETRGRVIPVTAFENAYANQGFSMRDLQKSATIVRITLVADRQGQLEYNLGPAYVAEL